LRGHAQRADPGGDRPVQLPGAGAEQAADVPLPVAARPDAVASRRSVSAAGGLIPDLSPLPRGAAVLVTGAGGFVGGHVARALAAAGYAVRGLSRRPPRVEPGDPPIDWRLGDLR